MDIATGVVAGKNKRIVFYGPPGCGKTAMALTVVQRLEGHLTDGVHHWIQLSLRDTVGNQEDQERELKKSLIDFGREFLSLVSECN